MAGEQPAIVVKMSRQVGVEFYGVEFGGVRVGVRWGVTNWK